jgi:hypothetical protein
MAFLVNARHEIVAQELAAGKTPTEASVIAGYPAGSSFAPNARRRAQHANIRARMVEILAERAMRTEGLRPHVHPNDVANTEYIATKLAQLASELPRAVNDLGLMVRIIGDLRRLLLALEQAASLPS